MNLFNPVYAGTAILTVGLSAAFKALGWAVAVTPGIEIHSLSFSADPAPIIIQDRTVSTTAPLVARWEAEIVAVDGGQRRGMCSGSGSWDYSAGHRIAPIPVDDWVGDDGCYDRLLSLPPGTSLQACARYSWGAGEGTSQCSLRFEVPRQPD